MYRENSTWVEWRKIIEYTKKLCGRKCRHVLNTHYVPFLYTLMMRMSTQLCVKKFSLHLLWSFMQLLYTNTNLNILLTIQLSNFVDVFDGLIYNYNIVFQFPRVLF